MDCDRTHLPLDIVGNGTAATHRAGRQGSR